jgi:hypothetical protein
MTKKIAIVSAISIFRLPSLSDRIGLLIDIDVNVAGKEKVQSGGKKRMQDEEGAGERESGRAGERESGRAGEREKFRRQLH